MAHECNSYLGEDVLHTDAYNLETPRVDQALEELLSEFSPSAVKPDLLKEATSKGPLRKEKRGVLYRETVAKVLDIAQNTQTHVSSLFAPAPISDRMFASGDMFKWRRVSYTVC